MPTRVVTISDHIDCPTGFGTQHRLLAAALARAGLDVHSLGIWDGRPVATTPDGVVRYPGGNGADVVIDPLAEDAGERISELERSVSQQQLELHLLAESLQRVRKQLVEVAPSLVGELEDEAPPPHY